VVGHGVFAKVTQDSTHGSELKILLVSIQYTKG
jgi:hypothetical protein